MLVCCLLKVFGVMGGVLDEVGHLRLGSARTEAGLGEREKGFLGKKLSPAYARLDWQ